MVNKIVVDIVSVNMIYPAVEGGISFLKQKTGPASPDLSYHFYDTF